MLSFTKGYTEDIKMFAAHTCARTHTHRNSLTVDAILIMRIGLWLGVFKRPFRVRVDMSTSLSLSLSLWLIVESMM